MKVKNLFYSLLSGIVMALSTSACNSDDPTDTISEQSLLRCYAVITDMQNPGSMEVCDQMTFKLTLNYTRATADVDITGLRIGSITYAMISLDNVGWGLNSKNWGAISEIAPKCSDAAGIGVTVSDFELKWYDRIDFANYLGAYDPGTVFSFIIDGRYQVRGSRNPYILAGQTISVDPAGAQFKSSTPVYFTNLDFTTAKAAITIANAQFAERMPALTMEFADLNYSISATGEVTLSKDALIPTISGTPQPNFPISNLQGTIVPGSGMTLTFNCTVGEALYTVTANVDYTSYSEVISSGSDIIVNF